MLRIQGCYMVTCTSLARDCNPWWQGKLPSNLACLEKEGSEQFAGLVDFSSRSVGYPIRYNLLWLPALTLNTSDLAASSNFFACTCATAESNDEQQLHYCR